jgi:hypothetical protein
MTLSPSQPQAAPRYSWAEIWTAVLTRPSVQTFQEILRDPAVSRRRAYTWMIVTWIVNIIFIAILTTRDTSQLIATLPSDMRLSPEELQSTMMLSMLCVLPFALLIGLAAFRLMVWLVQTIASQLGADVNYDSGLHSEKAKNSDAKANVNTLVTYSFAAVQAPLNIVSLLFAALPASPITGIISMAATCYQFYLMSLSLKAIYGFSTARALSAVFITFIVFFAATFAILFVLLRLM